MTNEYAMVTGVTVDPDVPTVSVNAVTGPGREEREIKFETPSKGFWSIPEPGDLVEIYEVERGPRARFPSNPEAESMPAGLGPGDLALQIGSDEFLKFVKQDDGTYDFSLGSSGTLKFQLGNDGSMTFNRQSDGTYNLTLNLSGKINIQTNGKADISASGNIVLDSEKDVKIESAGSITVGKNGARAALESHTHEFTDADGVNKTTSQPDAGSLSDTLIK